MEATTYEEIKAKFTNTGLEIEESIIDSAEALEIFRIKYLGSKSIIKDLAQYIKEVPGDHRKEAGMLLNHLKTAAENRYQSLQATLSSSPVRKIQPRSLCTWISDGAWSSSSCLHRDESDHRYF